MKSTLYVGFKMQLDQYEPIEIGASAELEGENVDEELKNVVMTRLRESAKEACKEVVVIKKKIIEELSDNDDW